MRQTFSYLCADKERERDKKREKRTRADLYLLFIYLLTRARGCSDIHRAREKFYY